MKKIRHTHIYIHTKPSHTRTQICARHVFVKFRTCNYCNMILPRPISVYNPFEDVIFIDDKTGVDETRRDETRQDEYIQNLSLSLKTKYLNRYSWSHFFFHFTVFQICTVYYISFSGRKGRILLFFSSTVCWMNKRAYSIGITKWENTATNNQPTNQPTHGYTSSYKVSEIKPLKDRYRRVGQSKIEGYVFRKRPPW